MELVGWRFGEEAKNSSDFHIKIARLGVEPGNQLEIEFSHGESMLTVLFQARVFSTSNGCQNAVCAAPAKPPAKE